LLLDSIIQQVVAFYTESREGITFRKVTSRIFYLCQKSAIQKGVAVFPPPLLNRPFGKGSPISSFRP